MSVATALCQNLDIRDGGKPFVDFVKLELLMQNVD